MALRYQFRPMSAADLPMVRRWLEMPHMAQWWHDPDTRFALVSEDLDHPAMDQFVVAADDRPFAYLQCYRSGIQLRRLITALVYAVPLRARVASVN